MADERILLPSLAEIEASNDIFSDPSRSVKVVRVRERFATQKRYIIMDYTPGTDLQKLAPFLPKDQKKTVSKRIREALDELRSIRSQGISGPFENEEQLNQGILKCLGQRESPHYVRLLRGPIQQTLRGHKAVFTHADLQPKNVIVGQNGVCEDGYWDYCNSTVYCKGKPEWLELVPDIFDEYSVGYLMMRVFYTSMIY
ncbi:hypothetical protein BDV09DRAFT_187612 [Aspergillus tetrazonus]